MLLVDFIIVVNASYVEFISTLTCEVVVARSLTVISMVVVIASNVSYVVGTVVVGNSKVDVIEF